MPRFVTVAAAQSGPVSRTETRASAVARRIEQLREAHARGCDLVVFPECALTAFFPHWWIADEAELDAWYEREMPGPESRPLFDEAARLKIAFVLGFAELAFEAGVKHRYNASVLVGGDGRIVGKYRKIHLPASFLSWAEAPTAIRAERPAAIQGGHADHRPQHPFQNLEKRCFEVGNLPLATWRMFGGVVGMCICNDRRWAETWRVLGLRGAELVLLGYNTPDHIPQHPECDHLVDFQSRLSMQAGAYQNGMWVVGVAKAGVEEGVSQLGQSMIVAPSGEVVAMSSTRGDELVTYRCDLDLVLPYKESMLNFARNRRVEHYGPITGQTAATPPPDLPR